MHIETLRKHRKSLIKARREIKAKLELLDTLLEEQKRKEAAEAYAAAAPERRAARERAADFINASIARQRAAVDPRGIAAIEGADAPDPVPPPAAPETELSGTGINVAWQATQAEVARRLARQRAADWQRERRAIDCDDPVYSKTDMARQRATAPPDGFLALAPYATTEASS